MPRTSSRVQFKNPRGLNLAGIVDHASISDEAPTPIVVFSHCFTCSKDLKAIVRISRRMAEAGTTVLRYDMTGLGGSEGDFSSTHFSSNIEDLRSAIDFANQSIGPVTALLGHSFGGAASLAIAATDSRSLGLRGVMTLAAPSDTVHLAELLIRMNPAIDLGDRLGEVSIGGRDWMITGEMIDDFRSHDLVQLLPSLDIPALLMHSPRDETVPFGHMKTIADSIGADASTIILHGADHLLSSQTDIEYVADLAAAFASRLAN